jgi:hypothetical protein
VVGSGLIVSGSGLLLLALTASPTVPLPVLLLGFSLVGLGNGQTTAPSTTLIMNSVPRSRAGVGSAVNDLSRELGGALGIAVLGSVLASIYRIDVGRRLGDLSTELVVRAQGSITGAFEAAGLAGESGDPTTAARIADQGRAAFSTAFGRTMFLGACVMAVNSAIVWKFQGRHRSAVVDVDGDGAGRSSTQASDLGGDRDRPTAS